MVINNKYSKISLQWKDICFYGHLLGLNTRLKGRDHCIINKAPSLIWRLLSKYATWKMLLNFNIWGNLINCTGYCYKPTLVIYGTLRKFLFCSGHDMHALCVFLYLNWILNSLSLFCICRSIAQKKYQNYWVTVPSRIRWQNATWLK
jgi:hypothetical protein